MGTACGSGTGRVITNTTSGIAEEATLVTDGYATDDLEEAGWTKFRRTSLSVDQRAVEDRPVQRGLRNHALCSSVRSSPRVQVCG